jgi:hypothetical protein
MVIAPAHALMLQGPSRTGLLVKHTSILFPIDTVVTINCDKAASDNIKCLFSSAMIFRVMGCITGCVVLWVS